MKLELWEELTRSLGRGSFWFVFLAWTGQRWLGKGWEGERVGAEEGLEAGNRTWGNRLRCRELGEGRKWAMVAFH